METQTQVGIQTPPVVVTTKLNPFSCNKSTRVFSSNTSLGSILDEMMPATVAGKVVVSINGTSIPHTMWDNTFPKSGTIVTVQAFAGGGDNTMRTVAMIGVMIAATWVSGPAGGLAAYGTIGTTGISYAAVAGMATMAVGMLAINAFIPLATNKFEQENTSPSLSITGARNQEKPFGIIPQILGWYRYTPPFFATPFTTREGGNQYLTMRFTAGYGPLQICNHRIGETPANDYSGVEMEVRNGYADDSPITLYQNLTEPQSVGIQLYYGTYGALDDQCNLTHPDHNDVDPPNEYTRTTEIECSSFDVNISFPNGIIKIKNQGDRESLTIVIEISYRIAGTSTWLLGAVEAVKGKTNSAIYRTATITPDAVDPEVKYEVMLRRMDPDHCEGVTADGDNTIYSASFWDGMTLYSADPAVTADSEMCLSQISMRILASNQLQGVIDNYSCECYAVVLDYDGTPGSWTKRLSNNPASLMRHVYQGKANNLARQDLRLDIDRLEAFHDWCSSRGFTFNMARDFKGTVDDTLRDVAAAGRGKISQIDGKWGVVYDDQSLYVNPVDIFTPRNSWGFSGARQFIDVPHAFKIRFVDANNDFKQRDVIAYDVGYSSANATIFESIEFPGLTNETENVRMGMYQLACARLRQEIFTFNADINQIRCTQGDAILVQHDAIGVGVGSARIRSVSGSDITLDTWFVIPDTPAVQIRSSTTMGQISYSTISNTPGTETNVLTLNTPPTTFAADDIVVLGTAGTETIKVIVDKIKPMQDMSATLICFAYAPGTDIA